MNAQRLLILAKHLEKHVPEREFDLGYWKKTSSECGTVACACGHATTIPAFQELGLVLEEGVDEDGPTFNIKLGNEYGWMAVAHFFDLNYSEAYYLFSSDEYEFEYEVTPKTVAARIEEFVKNDGMPKCD